MRESQLTNNSSKRREQAPRAEFLTHRFSFCSHPLVAEEELRVAAKGLQGITCMFDTVLFSAYLLTYAENIAF